LSREPTSTSQSRVDPDLVLVYDLADVEADLAFVQSALIAGELFFVAITGLIVWLVTTRSIQPIITTAAMAERFAAGNLDGAESTLRELTFLPSRPVSFNRMAESIFGSNQSPRNFFRRCNNNLCPTFRVNCGLHSRRSSLPGACCSNSATHSTKIRREPPSLLHRQIETFEQLLTELIELSRYDAEPRDFRTRANFSAVLAQSCIDEMTPLAGSQGSTITLYAPGGHKPVELDSRRVRRILHNFLANALDARRRRTMSSLGMMLSSTAVLFQFAIMGSACQRTMPKSVRSILAGGHRHTNVNLEDAIGSRHCAWLRETSRRHYRCLV